MKLMIIALLLAATPLEQKNAKVVADADALCTRSRCRPPPGLKAACTQWDCRQCGRLAYSSGGEVVYEPSNCERAVLQEEAAKAAIAEDEAIRAKYAKDGGQ